MQIKMYFFVKNIVLLFLFTPNDPENGKNERLLRIPYVPVRCLLLPDSVPPPFRVRFRNVKDRLINKQYLSND